MQKYGYEYDARDTFTRKDITVEEIVRLHNEGINNKEIARLYNTGETTILNRLKQGGIKIGRKELHIDEEQVISLYNQGISKSEISRRLIGYVHIKKINEILEKAGKKERTHYRTDIDEDDVCSKYKQYKSVKRVAKEFKVNRYVVGRILRERGYKIYSNEKNKSDLPDNEILRLYQEENKSGREIAKILSCSPTTIYSRLRAIKGRFKKHPTRRSNIDLETKKDIKSEFKKGKSVYRLSLDYKTTHNTIKKIVGLK